MYLLDTDVLIDIQRGYAPAITWAAGRHRCYLCNFGGELVLSVRD